MREWSMIEHVQELRTPLGAKECASLKIMHEERKKHGFALNHALKYGRIKFHGRGILATKAWFIPATSTVVERIETNRVDFHALNYGRGTFHDRDSGDLFRHTLSHDLLRIWAGPIFYPTL